MPGYWVYETTGVLRPAVEAYLNHDLLTPGHIAALRAYLRQWIELFEPPEWAPAAERRVIERLRLMIDGLIDRDTISVWIFQAEAIGCDPL